MYHRAVRRARLLNARFVLRHPLEVARTARLPEDASEDARYIARLNELARASVVSAITAHLRSEKMSERALAREAKVSIGALRQLLGGDTDSSLGTLIALAHAMRLGTLEGLLGSTPSALLRQRALEDGASQRLAG